VYALGQNVFVYKLLSFYLKDDVRGPGKQSDNGRFSLKLYLFSKNFLASRKKNPCKRLLWIIYQNCETKKPIAAPLKRVKKARNAETSVTFIGVMLSIENRNFNLG